MWVRDVISLLWHVNRLEDFTIYIHAIKLSTIITVSMLSTVLDCCHRSNLVGLYTGIGIRVFASWKLSWQGVYVTTNSALIPLCFQRFGPFENITAAFSGVHT